MTTLAELEAWLVQAAGGYLRNTIRERFVTCQVCTTPCGDWLRCYQCNQHHSTYSDRLADQVGLITYAVGGQQAGYVMRGYKSGVAEHRRVVAVATVVAVALHTGCVERLTGWSVSHWAAVPSLPAKPGRHAMATIAEIVPQGPEVVLEAAASVATRRAVNVDHFRVITPPLPQGSHVLLFDDTWTTGGHVQSAALALRAAGAEVVSALVVARWLQPGYAPTDEFVRTRLRTDFSPAVCPWTGTGCP